MHAASKMLQAAFFHIEDNEDWHVSKVSPLPPHADKMIILTFAHVPRVKKYKHFN